MEMCCYCVSTKLFHTKKTEITGTNVIFFFARLLSNELCCWAIGELHSSPLLASSCVTECMNS